MQPIDRGPRLAGAVATHQRPDRAFRRAIEPSVQAINQGRAPNVSSTVFPTSHILFEFGLSSPATFPYLSDASMTGLLHGFVSYGPALEFSLDGLQRGSVVRQVADALKKGVMLVAELRRKTLRAAGRQDGEFGERLPQPIDRECGYSVAKGGGVDGVLDLFRNFASRYEDPSLEVGLSFYRLQDLAPNPAFIETRGGLVAARLVYEVSDARHAAVATSLIARASIAERDIKQIAERGLCKALQAAGLGVKQNLSKLIAGVW